MSEPLHILSSKGTEDYRRLPIKHFYILALDLGNLKTRTHFELCTCMYIHVYTHGRVQMHICAFMWEPEVNHRCYNYVSIHCVLFRLGLISLALTEHMRLPGQWALSISASPSWHHKLKSAQPFFLYGLLKPNSGPHACAASALPTDPYSQNACFILTYCKVVKLYGDHSHHLLPKIKHNQYLQKEK